MTPDRRNRSIFTAAVCLAFFCIGCSGPMRSGGFSQNGHTDSVSAGLRSERRPAKFDKDDLDIDPEHRDKGDLVFAKHGNEELAVDLPGRYLSENANLQSALEKLNRVLALPADITLKTRSCGRVNAYYDPEDRSITFCDELPDHLYSLYKSVGRSDIRARERVDDAITFVFVHELGHALIDIYKLRITADEEEAADRVSTFICIEELGDPGINAVLAAAEAFAVESKSGLLNRRDSVDTHLMREKRFLNSLCMVYGSDPQKHLDLKGGTLLSENTAVRCQSEYARMTRSWARVLKPWRKK